MSWQEQADKLVGATDREGVTAKVSHFKSMSIVYVSRYKPRKVGLHIGQHAWVQAGKICYGPRAVEIKAERASDRELLISLLAGDQR